MKKSLIITGTALMLLSVGTTIVHPMSINTVQAKSNKHKSINQDLKKNLKKDKSNADNDPTNFGYTKYIESIKYTGNTSITVNVNGAFKDLDDDVKTEVMNQAQDLAKMVLYQDNKISKSDVSDGLVIMINNGGNSIGTTKMLNHKDYSWD